MSERGMQEAACEEIEKQASLYVFPGVSRQQQQQQYQGNTVSTLQLPPLSAPTILGSMRTNDVGEIKDIEDPSSRLRRRPYSKTHTRSASHGGVLASSSVTTNPITYQTSWQTPPWPTGGGSYLGPLPTLTGPIRPSALKKPGHQRAFSQGQVVDVQSQLPVSGHSRVGSRTDFILPPGHREESRPSTAGKVPSFRGHSRQASRSESIYTIRRSAAPPLWRRIWARYFGSLPDEPRLRTIVPNHLVPPRTSKSQHPNGGRVNNRIKTTKYTILNFIPRNLFEQCRRIANLYFIFIVLLNWVPDINAFGKEVAIIPVVFVLGVTALKDIFEDRRRSMSDRRINNSTCRVYVGEGGRYMQVAWKDVKVGDLVHLSNNEVVPADLLLLRSSDPQGLAYIDTCNLDGETNLKQRQVVRGFFELQDTFQPAKFRSMLEVDQPSTKINRFHGAVVHPNGGRVPVTIENLLLRECLLKNTDFIEGIVVYAGHETKAMLNNGGPRHKRSRLEKRMNCDIIWCMVILVKLCMIGAIGYRLWLSSFSSTILIPFLPVLQDPNYESMITFWTFVIILQVMIPLSLYVTIEMAKVGQIYHIGRDSFLYDKETGRRAECRALNITEELGQVQYIFSDKTGTLTENKMLFRRCAVGGQDYAHEGEGENLIPCPRLKEDLLIGTFRHRLQEFLIVLATCNTVVVNSQPHHDIMNSSGLIEEPHKNGSGPTRYERLSESRSVTPSPSPSIPPLPLPTPPASITGDSSSPISSIIDSAAVLNDPPKLQSKVVRPKLLNVTSIPSLSLGLLSRKQSPNGGQKRRNILSPIFDMSGKSVEQLTPTPAIYEAESPDELALVNAARAYDVKLLKRTPRNTIISLPDKSILSYEILYVLPFDSSRKCMSVVVRHPLTGEIILYSKGADTTVLASLTSSDENSMTSAKIRQQLNSYARQGLRTLVMARRSLTQQEYETWHEKHLEAELAIENRERRIRDSYASLENHMTLLGATGIEDKLQPGVPETITALVKAGIVVWVLTGDKPETAVNVAYSAGLFSPAMQLLQLQTRSKSVAETLIRGYLESAKRDNIMNDGVDNRNEDGIAMYSYDLTERDAHRIGSPWPRKRALVVDGKTLTVILDPRSGLTGPFLELTRTCSSVLACRATPLQKAYIVRIVKEQLRMRTLAIGDGANDVSMIQTADVGVGISGQEGRQAVMAADFAICRFYMLNRLLLLHGHWCYDRLSRMILYFFYKNATFVFLIFWFQFYCGFSGAVMIDQIYLMLYNLLFISLPPLVLGVYDRITTPNILLSMPELYKRGRLGLVYRPISFWITIADAFYESIVIFFTIFITYYDTTVDIWEFGTTITTACIFSMLLHVSIETRSWTIIHVLAIMGSLFIYMGFCLIYNAICINCMGLPGSFWIMEMAIRRHTYWLSVILTTVLAALPRLAYRSARSTLVPDMIQRATIAVSKTQGRRERIIERGNSSFITDWPSSTQVRNTTARPRSYGNQNDVLTTIVA
ncbi:phospholipid-transporting ATPase VA isoform X1 [Vespa velutina]|uniref:phospholipid-transporting ATPase VA isoform X1 n=1 Tax=Vespa velutina TaxID=202808 RepID=UPI001FB2602A|nr:phospholipid-transporting ATPase VA isoform X1 [Vespa velutina]